MDAFFERKMTLEVASEERLRVEFIEGGKESFDMFLAYNSPLPYVILTFIMGFFLSPIYVLSYFFFIVILFSLLVLCLLIHATPNLLSFLFELLKWLEFFEI